MTYDEALTYIHGTLRFGSKPGLDRIRKLLELLGNPQDGLKFVHTAGTNGKGSTCSAVASVLHKAGYRTGIYLSPFVSDFRERIQINGQMIPKEELARELSEMMPKIREMSEQGEQTTEFEIITALAFLYFKNKGCDAVVLEVGLGGRFDATNVISKPLVSVITSISYDHTEILGSTLSKIAFEKCGIIKDGSVTVSAPSQDVEALEVILRESARHGNTLIQPNLRAAEVLREGIEGTRVRYKGLEIFIPLAGRHQIANFITAFEVIEQLRGRYRMHISDEDIQKGMAEVRFPARMEILNKNPLILLDGAHNLSGVVSLKESLERYLKDRRLVVIMGMLADKDYEHAITVIARAAGYFIAVRPDSPRALEPEQTAAVAARSVEAEACGDYADAFAKARSKAAGEDVILVCGSLYLAGPMRRTILDLLRAGDKSRAMGRDSVKDR